MANKGVTGSDGFVTGGKIRNSIKNGEYDFGVVKSECLGLILLTPSNGVRPDSSVGRAAD